MTDRPDTPQGIEPRWRTSVGRWCYRVRWTDPVTGRRMAEEFDTVDEAEAFRARRDELRGRGALDELGRGRRTIGEYVETTWLPEYVDVELEKNTRPSYRSTWRCHLEPRVGHILLGHLTTPNVVTLREDLRRAGRGEPTIRRALAVLQGICSHAIEAGEMPAPNPCRDVRKPKVTRQLTVRPQSPDQVEALRAELEPEDVAIVSILAYEGPRSFSETFALEEHHIGLTTLLIAQRNVEGEIVVGLKTSKRRPRASRNPTLWAPVRADLEQHLALLERRGPGRRKLLFPAEDGRPWTRADYRRWTRNVFQPAAKRAGLDITRPYDLRHSCASLLLHAGMGAREISEHLGHSVSTLSAFYAHLIADLRGVPPTPVEQQIAAARARRMEDAA